MAASSSTNVPATNDYVVPSQGPQRVTIVWLHDKDGHFLDSVNFVKSLKLRNIHWICPPVAYRNTSYDFGSNIKQDDREGIDSAAKLVAGLLLAEPLNVVKGVGGFGMGAVVALQFAANCALGHYPLSPRVVVGVNGWLSIAKSIQSSMESTVGAFTRAQSHRILLTRSTNDRILPYTREEEAADSLSEAGFGRIIVLPSSRLEPIGNDTPSVRSQVIFWLELSLPVGADYNKDPALFSDL